MQRWQEIRFGFYRLIEQIREKGLASGVRAVWAYLFGKISWSFLKLFYKSEDGLILKECRGNKMYLDISDPGLSRQLLLNGSREKLPNEIIGKWIKKGMNVVDIGANLGYYVLQEAAMVGEEGKVFAIEPVPGNFEILSKNIEINEYKNIHPFCKAVGASSGKDKMYLSHASNWHSMVGLREEDQSDFMKGWFANKIKETIEVETVALDDFLEEQNAGNINFMRMDIEGYEVEAIKGMLDTLKNTPPPMLLFFEIHCGHFADVETGLLPTLKQLLEFGFEPIRAFEHKEIPISRETFSETIRKYRHGAMHLFLEKK